MNARSVAIDASAAGFRVHMHRKLKTTTCKRDLNVQDRGETETSSFQGDGDVSNVRFKTKTSRPKLNACWFVPQT